MDRWAASLPGVAFVCVSCAGPALAVAFRDRLGLRHCHNAYVASEKHMPEWGQLGCNGFIVLDADMRVVCPATEAFLDVGPDRAFPHVESILERLLQSETHQGREKEEEEEEQQQQRTTGGCSTGRCELPVKRSAPLSDPERGRDIAANKASSAEDSADSASADCDSDHSPGAGSDVASANALLEIHATGVKAMDAEHDECASALQALQEHRSRTALRLALDCVSRHFAHEERVLDTTIWANAAALDQRDGGRQLPGAEQADVLPDIPAKAPARGFSAESSARRSHFADHARMLRAMAEQLEALAAAGKLEEAPALEPAFVDKLLSDFVAHANMYDAAYAGGVIDPACDI
mmetsp:Transcript_13062/g.33549  ORF Transcript_13062/g.33549 Transcript_13062/m.33549 type:complete len:350 (+) Transcript_13062:531-1580(+)